MAQNNNALNLHPNNIGNNLGITSDLTFKYKQGNFGLYTFLGLSQQNDIISDFVTSYAIHFTHKNFTGILQYNISFNLLVLPYQSGTFGIQYRLPRKVFNFRQ